MVDTIIPPSPGYETIHNIYTTLLPSLYFWLWSDVGFDHVMLLKYAIYSLYK